MLERKASINDALHRMDSRKSQACGDFFIPMKQTARCSVVV
jgi:hypothetical protein